MTPSERETIQLVLDRLRAIERANTGRQGMGQRQGTARVAAEIRERLQDLAGFGLVPYPRWIDEAERVGDMDPDTSLRIVRERDGDVILEIRRKVFGTVGVGGVAAVPALMGLESRSVQFCTIGSGGGRSPNTHRALCELAIAIEQDRAARPDSTLALVGNDVESRD